MIMNRTILVVDDNDQHRLLLCDILAYNGYQVMDAKNGVEGIKMAKKSLPDLVLLDIQMPVMDGFAIVEQLKGEPALDGTKIVALTSLAMLGDRERIMVAGFDGYLAKPVDTRTLSQLVRNWLGEEGADQ